MRNLAKALNIVLSGALLLVPFLLGGWLGYALTQFPDACSRVNDVCNGYTPYFLMIGYALVLYNSIGTVVSLIKLRMQFKRDAVLDLVWFELSANAVMALLGAILISIVMLRVF